MKIDRLGVVGYGNYEYGAVMMAAAHLGLRIPEDLSCITFQSRTDQIFGPFPSCMLIPQKEVGSVATEMLLAKINDPNKANSPSQAIPEEFFPGQTVGKLER